jgi:hypothetical protein
MKYSVFIISVILLLIITSCEDIIEVDVKEGAVKYAIEGQVDNLEGPHVRVTKTVLITQDTYPEPVRDAVVTISDDQNPPNIIVLEESPDSAGLYVVPDNEEYLGIENRTYFLEIKSEGKIFRAQDHLFPVSEIDSIQVYPSKRGDGLFNGVFTYGWETPGPGDYYKWDVYVNDTLIHDADFIMVVNDEFVDGKYIEGFEVLTDFHNPDNPEEKKIHEGDRVYVHQMSLSPFAYKYYYQVFSQAGTGFLFSVPPANIESNITCDTGEEALGLFSAVDISVSETDIAPATKD